MSGPNCVGLSLQNMDLRIMLYHPAKALSLILTLLLNFTWPPAKDFRCKWDLRISFVAKKNVVTQRTLNEMNSHGETACIRNSKYVLF